MRAFQGMIQTETLSPAAGAQIGAETGAEALIPEHRLQLLAPRMTRSCTDVSYASSGTTRPGPLECLVDVFYRRQMTCIAMIERVSIMSP